MSKLPHIGTTIFTVMSKMAADHKAINLSQGFPNFPVDERLTDIIQSIATDSVHQYYPMVGYAPLLEQIAAKVESSYGRRINPGTEILVTAGATQAIFCTIQALVTKDNEVIILDPAYDCYEPAVILSGGIPKRIALKSDFTPDWDKIEAAFSARTSMIIINNPHNPSGRIFNQTDFERLEKLLEKFPQVKLLSDEVYEYITFEQKHISANTRPALIDKTIVVSSFGKTFHITGWKIGYLVAPAHLLDEIKKVHQFVVFSVNSLAQTALANYMEIVDVKALGGFYQEKRDLFRQLLTHSRFELLPCEGSYFQVASYKNISSESDVAFTKRLVLEHGVAAIPMSVFNADQRDDHVIRFCFAKDTETLIQATDKLCKI
jgi:methionine aminotransferase